MSGNFSGKKKGVKFCRRISAGKKRRGILFAEFQRKKTAWNSVSKFQRKNRRGILSAKIQRKKTARNFVSKFQRKKIGAEFCQQISAEKNRRGILSANFSGKKSAWNFVSEFQRKKTKKKFGFTEEKMKKSVLILAAAFAGFALSAKDVSLKKQGMFSSGGSVTEAVPGKYDETTNWLSPTREGNTAHVDHANVFYQIPSKEKGSPVVFLHGYGQSRMGWMTTPDGRDGWSDIFLRNGRAVFLVDQPRRGEAGSTVSMTQGFIDTFSDRTNFYLPGDQAWYTHFRIGRVAPDRYDGSKFPAGEKVQDQFFRQMTPNTGAYDEKLFGESLSSVLSDAAEISGKKIVYVTHSQGGRVGWQTETKNMAALIAVEPGGCPVPGSDEYKKFLEAKIPMIVIFGDYIDNGPADIKSTSFWKGVRDQAEDFAENYRNDGGDAEVWDLPKMGITGNSHFMFQETNNREIADLIEKWLKAHRL